MKDVIYIGGKPVNYRYPNARDLVVGNIYTVLDVYNEPSYLGTRYTLAGFMGTFNSKWFEDVLPTYFAIGNNNPVEGKSYKCTKIDIKNGKIDEQEVETDVVNSVKYIGENTYKATTHESIYIVKVI